MQVSRLGLSQDAVIALRQTPFAAYAGLTLKLGTYAKRTRRVSKDYI